MSYDERDAFYDRMSEELYPEHKGQAIDEFVEERMQSCYLANPNVIQTPVDCYHLANELLKISPRCALVMYTTAIELFLKSILLKPVLYGMVPNENIANVIVDSTTGQSGFSQVGEGYHLSTFLRNIAQFDQKSPIGAFIVKVTYGRIAINSILCRFTKHYY